MKLKNFELKLTNKEAHEVTAMIETVYFSARVSMKRIKLKTKWIFGVKSLAPKYKMEIKKILRDILKDGKAPIKQLKVVPA